MFCGEGKLHSQGSEACGHETSALNVPVSRDGTSAVADAFALNPKP